MSTDTWTAAARVVRSAGFGATTPLVDAVARQGVAAWVDASLRADPAADPGAAKTPAPKLTVVPPAAQGASQEERRKVREQAREQVGTLTRWWIARMVTVENPVAEKVAFGWHDHFATSAGKVRSASLLLAQNERFRSLGRGDFGTLAEAMVVDPALVYWLDGHRNTAKAPNENLSREFIELFTLGHGSGYTEADVKEGARALTGYAYDRATGTLRFTPGRHDKGTKTVLGVTGDLDAKGFVRAALGHPASAPFVVRRWWRLLASPDDPPAATLERLTAAYGPSRDFTALCRAIVTDEAYAAATGSLVVSPLEWVVGSMRALKVPTDEETLGRVAGLLRTLGQVPFYPPNVSGWPAGQAWLSTASATTRVRGATTLARTGDVSAVADAAPAARVDAVAELLALPSLSTRTATALKSVSDPRRLVAMALVSPENLVI